MRTTSATAPTNTMVALSAAGTLQRRSRKAAGGRRTLVATNASSTGSSTVQTRPTRMPSKVTAAAMTSHRKLQTANQTRPRAMTRSRVGASSDAWATRSRSRPILMFVVLLRVLLGVQFGIVRMDHSFAAHADAHVRLLLVGVLLISTPLARLYSAGNRGAIQAGTESGRMLLADRGT